MACERCGAACVRNGAMQRYCFPCSEAKSDERRRAWEARNPEAAARAKRRHDAVRKPAGVARGIRISEAERWPLGSVFPDERGMRWVRRVAVPYTLAFSKNHLFTVGESGHVARRRRLNEAKENLVAAVRAAIADVTVLHGKLWLAMVVQKPNNRSDAVNFVDHVCDAVAKATGLDDRWYCFKQIDWQIVKDGPLLMLGLGQDISEPHQACACCGRVLPFGMFWRTKHTKNGVGRECKDCMKADRK